MIVPDNSATANTGMDKLMTFAEFEAFVAANEWISNEEFDSESYPNHPWFRVKTMEVQHYLDGASTKILKAIGTAPKDDVELRHLERNAFEVRHVQHGHARKIFFMGIAGVGKSSIFNAFFNQPGLAKTGAKGDACTSVVVRYTAAAHGTSDGFSVTIHFLRAVTIKDFIDSHSKVYFQRQFSTPEPDEVNNDVESTEVKQVETARKFFSLLFGEEDDFRKFFTPRTFQDGSFQNLCLEKSLAKLSKIGMDHHTFTKQQFFRDSEELQTSMEGYMTDVEGKECYWHLVDSIEIKCPFPMLRHNLEFVDSPGLGELNQTRMASTNRAKDGADLLCIIGDTDRIKVNELIMDSAVQAITQHGPEKVVMIATKIDVLVDQDVLQELGPLYQRARELLSWVKVKKVMATSQKLDKQVLRQLSRYERYILRQMKEAFVMDRARALQAQIPDTLKELSDRSLADRISAMKVFSVSSAQYMRWAENSEFSFDQAPELSLHATGIPGLRRHLLSLAADQNLQDYRCHVRDFFPGLVAKVRRVIDPSRSEGFKTIAKTFDGTIKNAISEFDTILTRCLKEIADQILQILLEDKDHYLSFLDQEAENWTNISYFTFRKIVREHGILSTGSSKMVKMRRGYNINRNIARLLTPAFRSLVRQQKPKYQDMAIELHEVRKRVSGMFVSSIDSADSDLRSIEEAKKIWAPKGLALTTPINTLITKLEQMADSIMTLATRETDYLSFIARQTSDIFAQVHVARPEKIQRTLKKRKSSAGEPVVIYVNEKPVGVFARELLHKLLREGASTQDLKAEDDESENSVSTLGHTDIVEKIMIALDGMIQRRYKIYKDEFLEGIKTSMREFLDEIRELAPAEVEITEDGRAARARLADIVGELDKFREELQGLVPAAV